PQRFERALPGGLELVPWRPGGHAGGLGDAVAEGELEAGVLDGAGEVPVGGQLVGGLVVAGLLPGLALLPSPAGRAPAVVEPALEVGGGDADPGEAELVAPVEVPPVRELVAAEDASLPAGEGPEGGVEVGLPQSDDRDVTGAAEDVGSVDVDV